MVHGTMRSGEPQCIFAAACIQALHSCAVLHLLYTMSPMDSITEHACTPADCAPHPATCRLLSGSGRIAMRQHHDSSARIDVQQSIGRSSAGQGDWRMRQPARTPVHSMVLQAYYGSASVRLAAPWQFTEQRHKVRDPAQCSFPRPYPAEALPFLVSGVDTIPNRAHTTHSKG